MSAATPGKKHQARAFCAFLLAACSCLLGLSFCLIKSPQAQSNAYLAAALSAYGTHQTGEAAAAAMEAVRLNPSNVEGWRMLSRLLQQNGQDTASRQASIIASRMQRNPADTLPLYAMPAELKLSFLAGGRVDIP